MPPALFYGKKDRLREENQAIIGENGFGYDPIFAPKGLEISSAQMSATEKDELSHRGKALRAIAPKVLSALNSYS
jgi:XTP/dITP diphosphohydrolase